MAKFTIWQIVLLTPGYIFASGFKPVRTLAIDIRKRLVSRHWYANWRSSKVPGYFTLCKSEECVGSNGTIALVATFMSLSAQIALSYFLKWPDSELLMLIRDTFTNSTTTQFSVPLEHQI